MVIENYDVKTTSQRSYLSIQSTIMTMKKEIRAIPEPEPKKEAEDEVSISDTVKEMYEKMVDNSNSLLEQSTKAAAAAKYAQFGKRPLTPDELKLTLLQMMIEKLTGKKLSTNIIKLDEDTVNRLNNEFFAFRGGSAGSVGTVESWDVESFTYESERLSYQAQGIVKTADGKTISLDINMYMSREFVSYASASIKIEKPVDPLVINYGGTAASLTGEKFEFDLTMDGKMEKLSTLGAGSGFLAIDLNGDGKINDGSELFGPRTGSGFDELRAYDQDGNGWIDEADDIFSKLLVWSRDKDGNDQIFTLKELGIGAIFLGDIDTQFSFKDDSNQTSGVMRSTSFFLKENGGEGTISHIDMMI